MTCNEPALYALSVVPNSARPGDVVRVEFRTPNLGSKASPPGSVAFVLGDGLEALGDLDVGVGSVAPGEHVTASVSARVVPPSAPRVRCTVGAVLRVPGAEFVTNRCSIEVCSRAVVDGAGSGVFVEPLDAQTVLVRAVVSNEGDGPAAALRIVVPTPPGCVPIGGDEATVMDVAQLALGEIVTLTYEARLVSPRAVLCADDGEVRSADGRRCALPARNSIALAPALAAPEIVVRAARRHADVTIDLRNDGWLDARDVRVRILLPAPLRIVDGSVTVDAVPAVRAARRGGGEAPFARVERRSKDHAVVIDTVPARGGASIALMVTFPMGYPAGTIGVGLDDHDVAMTLQPQSVRDVRVRVTDAPAAAAPGEAVRIVAHLVNAGDQPETVVLSIAGDVIEPVLSPPRTLAPWSTALVESVVDVSERAGDGATAVVSVAVIVDEGERARAECTLRIRDRARLGAEEAPEAIDRPSPAVVHAVLRAPADVVAGAPLALGIDVDVEDDVDALAIRVPPVPGAVYVAGSCWLDGSVLLDRACGSPFAGNGLRLRAVPAGTRISCAWSVLAAPSSDAAELVIAAAIDVDGESRTVAPVNVDVRCRDAFAARPAARPYHVDAFTLPRAAIAEPAAAYDEALPLAVDPAPLPAEHQPVTFGIRLDAERCDEILRLLDGAPQGGLIAHVLALRACFPDDCIPGDAATADALVALRTALFDVYDRLFVKLRIPGFACSADDLDDPPLRRALGTLCDRLGRHGDVAALSAAPYGAPALLRTLAALLPVHCDDAAFGAALGRFAAALDAALARYEDASPAAFDDALARSEDSHLDSARSALRDAAAARFSPLELAC
jgi:hypothetical protein